MSIVLLTEANIPYLIIKQIINIFVEKVVKIAF
jgi:hypothetical protein